MTSNTRIVCNNNLPTRKERGFILWRGRSWIDGKPVMAVATMRSTNRKTGDMVQVWILREDIDPVTAIKRGEDRSICGECIHRGTDGFKGRSCYVDAAKAPLAVWKTAKRGGYRRLNVRQIAKALAGSKVRLGAYGDPAVLPERVIAAITAQAKMHTGYTHQWRDPRGAHARRWCMASCDSRAEVEQARADGWRVFHVGTERIDGDKVCPASTEEIERTGRDASCDRCGLCSGTHTTAGRDLTATRSVASVISIVPHGAGARNLPTKLVSLTINQTK